MGSYFETHHQGQRSDEGTDCLKRDDERLVCVTALPPQTVQRCTEGGSSIFSQPETLLMVVCAHIRDS